MVNVTFITASLPHRSELLKDCIASVAAQTVPSSHLVLVDANQSVAQARNTLVQSAATEWVAFLDDDDLADPEHVAALLRYSENADVVIPYCRFDGPPLPDGYFNREYDRETLKAHGIFPITVLARRQAILDVGGFPLYGQWEDWELWNAMADNGARFRNCPHATWTYRTATGDRRTHLLQGRA